MKKETFSLFFIILCFTACNVLPTPIPSQTPIQTKIPATYIIPPTQKNISATHTITPTKDPKKNIVLTSEALILKDLVFLSGHPCLAPCFLGITPGETPFDSVLDVLSEHLYHSIWDCKYDSLYGIIGCSLPGTFDIIRISPNSSTELVDGIGYSPSPPIFLGDIIEHYGEPDQMYLWDSLAGVRIPVKSSTDSGLCRPL